MIELFCNHCLTYSKISLVTKTGDVWNCPSCLGLNILEGRKVKETGVNPKDAVGIKKPPINFVPPILEILTSMAFKDGSVKYGPFNWRDKKVKWTIYYAAAKRHLSAAFDGEDIDPISKVPHLAHAAACIAILMDAEACNCLIDDRPLKGPSAEVINKYTEKN